MHLPLKRGSCYAIYLSLLALGVLCYLASRQGAVPYPLAVIFLALIVFCLYTLTLFLITRAKEKAFDQRSLLDFIRRRKLALTFFLLSLLLLSLLIIISR